MLTEEQRRALLREAKRDLSHFMYDWILWQLNTGMRPGETARLMETDIDLKKESFRLYETKTHDSRWMKLNRTALDIAWKRWAGDGKWLFRSSRGLKLNRQIVNQAFARIPSTSRVALAPSL